MATFEWELQLPHSRQFVTSGRLDAPGDKLLATIERHCLNHMAEILLPCTTSDGAAAAARQVNEALRDVTMNRSFHRCVVPLADFLNPDYIVPLLDQGRLYAISCNSQLDGGTVVAVTPSGKAYVALDKESYEKFGLVGKPSAVDPKGTRFNVTINLRNAGAGSTPGRDRVAWALGERMKPVTLLVQYEPRDPTTTLSFPMSATTTALSVEAGQGEAAACAVPLAAALDDVAERDEVIEWCGLIHARAAVITQATLSTQHREYLANIRTPVPNAPGAVHALRWRGMLGTEFIASLLRTATQALATLPYVVLSVWGFDDAPVSWEPAEHGTLISGSNDYTVVLRSDGSYLCRASMGEQDTYSS